jgi:hypothetical protein
VGKRKRTKGQTKVYKTLNRRLKLEQQEDGENKTDMFSGALEG